MAWNFLTAMGRGFVQRCPRCGTGALYFRYLKVAQTCSACGLALHPHRADDAPPYFTIFIVGHLVIPPMLWVEQAYQPQLWLHAALWLPLSVLLCLLLLPRVKGAVVALQWLNGMDGFEATPRQLLP